MHGTLQTVNNRLATSVAGFVGFLAVLFGAFGAHMLRGLLERAGTIQYWQTGVLYHLAHAVVLLVLAGWRPVPRLAFLLLLCGVVFFSGSLYALALTNFRWLGAITPLGGVGMLLGWLSLALRKGKASGTGG
jgi:uncharacterized membrane protein YgdD (TMEM256/DUF423 family)